MFLSIITLFLTALGVGFLFEKMKLPALLGYMLTGMIFSPYALDYFRVHAPLAGLPFISNQMLTNSTPFRELALFIILFRAGLGLDKSGLKLHGSSAIRLSVIPCLVEASLVSIMAYLIFQIPLVEAALIGFVLAAVSPAVIVPQMLSLQQEKIGHDKKVPTLILAASTVDDIVAISGFSVCLALLSTSGNNDWRLLLLQIPVSVITGLVIGYYLAKPLLSVLKGSRVPYFFCALVLIGIAFGLKELEASQLFFFSHLMAILSLGLTIQNFDVDFTQEISKWMSRIWDVAAIFLFVLIGAMVNPTMALNTGAYGVVILVGGLLARSMGVLISLKGSHLNLSEKMFCVVSYIPKATVQAAVGSMALAMFLEGKIWLYNGASTGELIIAMAALSIVITAPLGAMGMRFSCKRLLSGPGERTNGIS